MSKTLFFFSLVAFCLILAPITTRCQIVINFNPLLHGQTVNGLFMAQISNSGGSSYEGRMLVTVRDDRNKLVIQLRSVPFQVMPGNNYLQTAYFTQNSVRFGNSPAAGTLSQTGKFPEGEFEYCYEFSTVAKPGGPDEQAFENCFNAFIQPFTVLQLQSPDDGDSICTQRPEFSWQPLIPTVPGISYRLFITEKKERQSNQEAIANNLPILNQNNINGFNHFFPPQLMPLTTGKTYVWQVTAYNRQSMIIKSEIWEFTVGCADIRKDTIKESYRELKPSLNGSFYTANEKLMFSVTNPYEPSEMEYQLIDLSNQQIKFDRLPVIKLQRGLNKIDIDLLEIKGLVPGKMYQLNINNVGNQKLYLRFIYKAEGIE